MKKIEFFVSDEKLKMVDKLRKKEQFTRAELMRRALDQYLQIQKNIGLVSSNITESLN